MAEEKEKKSKFINIGTMMLAKKKDANDEDEPNKYYIKLEQKEDKEGNIIGEKVFPITLANGRVLESGDILAMFSKKSQFKWLVENDKMTQEKADELSKFLIFDICVGEKQNKDKDTKDGVNF